MQNRNSRPQQQQQQQQRRTPQLSTVSQPRSSSNRMQTSPAAMETASNALLDAVNRGKSHLVKFILEACEGDVKLATNYRDFKGKTPLMRAVYITEEKCRQRIMEILLEHGADPNYQDDAGRAALSYACELRHNDVVRLLIKHNVDPEMPDNEGNTPLMHCARVGNDTGIGILIKCFRRLGLDIDRCNNDGFTAMLIAARHGYTESASLLAIEGHASVTRTDARYGRNAEQWARAQGCTTPEVALFSPAAEKLIKRRHKSQLRVDPHAYPSSRTSPNRSSVVIGVIQQPPWNHSGPGAKTPQKSNKSPSGSSFGSSHQLADVAGGKPPPQPRKSLMPKEAANIAGSTNRSRSSTVTPVLAGSRTNLRGGADSNMAAESCSSSGSGSTSTSTSIKRGAGAGPGPVRALPVVQVTEKRLPPSGDQAAAAAVAAANDSDGSLSEVDLDDLYNTLTSQYTVEEMTKRAGLANPGEISSMPCQEEEGASTGTTCATSVSLDNLHL